MFCEAWGTEALKKQTEFNNFLEVKFFPHLFLWAVFSDHLQG
jgi:hypothetical protein